ncbi:MAG: apolipoprotein N-acyltransferase [Methylococcales bacterium]
MGYFVAFLSGLALPFAFAPFDYNFITILSLASLFYVWNNATPRGATLKGYLFGLGHFGVGVSWVFVSMHEYGGASIVGSIGLTSLFVAILSLYPAVIGYLAARFTFGNSHLRLVLVFPSLWIFGEWFRGLFFTGFPWLQIGYTQLDGSLAGFIPIVGVYGTGWLLALTSALLLAAVLNRGCKQWIVAGLVIIIWAGGWASRSIQWSKPIGAPFKATLIQGNIPQDLKWAPEIQRQTLDFYAQLTREHLDSDVVIWPETAIPTTYSQVKDGYMADLMNELRPHNTDLLTGILVTIPETNEFYNGMVSLAEPDQLYLKRHLVPFGEFLPFRPITRFVLDIMQIQMADFSSGEKEQPLLKAAGYPLVSSICYEDVFGDEARTGVQEGAYLVNVTNDAWFGNSLALYQHFQMARTRALEAGRYLLRASNTGVTAVVSSSGKVLAIAPAFKRTAITEEVVPMTGITPYVRFGDSFVLIVLLLILVGLWLRNGK